MSLSDLRVEQVAELRRRTMGASEGYRVEGFRGLGSRGLGSRGLGFRVEGFGSLNP